MYGLQPVPKSPFSLRKGQRVKNTERSKIALPTMRGGWHIRFPDLKEGVTENAAGRGAQQVCEIPG